MTDQEDWSDDPTMWSAQSQSSQKCTFFILPVVSICFKAKKGHLHLGLRTGETAPRRRHSCCLTRSSDSSSSSEFGDDNDGIDSETKIMKIYLDNVLVTEKRGAEVLLFRKPLVELENGRHSVQYIVTFDSGDVLMYHRVLVYNGPTARGSSDHVLESSGSGVLSPERPVATWRLADGLLPCAVTLRSPSKAPLALRSSRGFAELTDGEAILTEFGDDRVFVVESRAFTDAPYDMRVGPLPASPRLLSWERPPGSDACKPLNAALVVGTAQSAHVGTAQLDDSDAVSWVNLLIEAEFSFRLLGSASCSYSPHVPVGYATTTNIRVCLGDGIPAVVGSGSIVILCWTGDELACAGGESLGVDVLVELSDRILKTGASLAMFFDACNVSELAAKMKLVSKSENWFVASADSGSGATVTPGAFNHVLLTRGLASVEPGMTAGEVFDRAHHAYRYTRPGMAPIRCEGDRSLVLFR